MKLQDRFRGCLLGLAAGAAVGAAVEFKTRGSFPPLTDMVGGGPHRLEPGQWTDDTSMALCLATSLIECDGFDVRDQMERYVRWWREGYLSSKGHCFDIGNATSAALSRFRETGDPYAGSEDRRSSGNGNLMRLAPVPMFYYPDREAAERFAMESSRTTHGSPLCLDAGRLFARVLVRALSGAAKEEIVLADADEFTGCPEITAIARGAYLDKGENEIEGSGYVVESLEASLWCFMRTDTCRDAILLAANLGNDADTTAAICGQVAGAFYGEAGIPNGWLEKLTQCREIRGLADQLYAGAMRRAG